MPPAGTLPAVPAGRDGRGGLQAPAGAHSIGKYLVHPLIRALENGWFASSVSIRSGSGSATTDRVLRLTRLFRCARQAAAYAHDEALRWISGSASPVAARAA